MKKMLVFTMPDDSEEFEMANKASNYSNAIFRIKQEVFRPHRKHGYNDDKLNKLLESNPICYDVINILENMTYEILNQEDIKE